MCARRTAPCHQVCWGEREEEVIYLLTTLIFRFAASRRHGPASGVRQDPSRRADTQSGRMLIASIAVILDNYLGRAPFGSRNELKYIMNPLWNFLLYLLSLKRCIRYTFLIKFYRILSTQKFKLFNLKILHLISFISHLFFYSSTQIKKQFLRL